MIFTLQKVASTLCFLSLAQAVPTPQAPSGPQLAARCNGLAIRLPSFPNLSVLEVDTQLKLNQTIGPPAIPGVNLEEIFGRSIPIISGVDYCSVTVTYTHPGWNDAINVNVYLPFAWNDRFLAIGGGGLTAGSPTSMFLQMLFAQTQRYAQASTDAGHSGEPSSSNPWPHSSPGNLNWPLLVDFGYLALHELSVVSKAVIQSFYQKPPRYSYFFGGSTGGRQGHMLAQKYPEDFNGIVGHFPAIYWNRLMATLAWPPFVMDKLGYYPPPCELNAITAATIDQCDELDGVKDGIISNPGLCKADPNSFVGRQYICDGRTRTITSNGSKIMKAVWEGPQSASGEFQGYGYAPGTNVSTLAGAAATTCDAQGNNCKALPFVLTHQWFQWFVKKDPKFSRRNISQEVWDQLVHDGLVEFSSTMETDDVDLTKLRKSGTKLLNWHGTADPLIPMNSSTVYYDRALAKQPDAPNYYRLFLAPGGVHQDVGGIAPLMQSVLAQMEDWVEKGIVPDVLHAQGRSPQGATMKRDLCSYPKQLHYRGGNFTEASSFICV